MGIGISGEVIEQMAFVLWLKKHKMYNPMESSETMLKMFRIYEAVYKSIDLAVEKERKACEELCNQADHLLNCEGDTMQSQASVASMLAKLIRERAISQE